MNMINDKCWDKYCPEDQVYETVVKNKPYNLEIVYSEKKMEEFNPGCFPPHLLRFKIGAPMMLLRNWSLSEGLANGTLLRVHDVGEKLHVIQCEILSGPKFKKPVVPRLKY